jgi:hypothetical protein
MNMRSRRNERGSALLMSMIVVLVITAVGLAVIRFASRDLAGATSGRKEAAIAACAEAARTLLMSQWKLFGSHGVVVGPLDVVLDTASQTHVQGGHYGDDPNANWNASTGTWNKYPVGNPSAGQPMNVQVVQMNPLVVGSAYSASDLTNRIGETVQNYRIVVHCTQADGRQAEVEFGVQYGL